MMKSARFADDLSIITQVLAEQVDIMKRLRHHHIVGLIEVIDDPDSDYFYMGMNE